MLLRGRSECLAVALNALTAAQANGEGSVLLVTGEPGIGKTVFVRAILEQAVRREFGAGYAAADEANQLVPGATLLLALRSGAHPLVDRVSFAKLAEPSMQPLWLAEDVADLLDRRAQRSPLVIVLDDVQWADQLSRFLLRVLPGRLAGSPVVWVLAGRAGPEATQDPFTGAGLSEGVRYHQIELGPLSDEDMVHVATDVLGGTPSAQLAGWLGQVDGNPFLAVELAEAIRRAQATGRDDGQLPPLFSARLRKRLRDLPGPTVGLLQLAAAWGGPMPMADAHQLAGGAGAVSEQVAEAARAGLMETPGDSIAFRHDLVREFVYREIPSVERGRLHRLLAHHLLDSGHRAIEAAGHAAIGARTGDRRSVDILRRAAMESLAVVPHTAAQLMKQAFEAVAVTEPEWAQIGEQYVDVLCRAQRGGDAIEVVDALLAQTSRQDDRARLQVMGAHALWLTGRPQDITARVQHQLSRPSGDAAVRVRLEAARALALSRVGTPAQASAAAEDALVRARHLDDRAAEVTALHALAEVARNEGRQLLAYERFHELRTSLGADYLPQEILSLQHLDRFDEAERLLDQAMRRTGHSPDTQSPALASAQVWQLFNRGRFEDASAAGRSLIRLGDELRNYVHRQDARIAMTICALIRGDVPGAHALVALAEAERGATAGVAAPGLLLVRARIAEAEGDYGRSREFLQQLDSDTSSSHLYWSRSLAQFRLRIGIALAVGDHELAEQTRAHSASAADRNTGVSSYRGVALQVSGLVDGDLEKLGAAADLLQNCPRPSMRATAAADYGRALLEAGHRAAGIGRLEQAWTTYDGLGSVAAAAGVQRVLSRAGVRRRRRPTVDRPVTGWGSLTPTEATVARLVAEGHTNRTAAETLGISVNTVGTHLNSVFAKLGVRSRLQLSHTVRGAPADMRRTPG